MRVVNSLDAIAPEVDVVLTIGTFDGVHRGHLYLLEQLIRHARDTGRLSAALTFHPHPRVLLHPEVRPAYLSSPEERAAILESLGLDLLVLLPFTRALADTPAEHLIARLYRSLRMRELWVGTDFAMGRQRGGDIGRLKALAQELGFILQAVEPLRDRGGTISSTRIRSLLFKGRVDEAARLLGRYYSIVGQVSQGAQRGRTLGFRTANLRPDPERAVPADGVYAVWVRADGPRYAGVANVGVHPTFGVGERTIEAHLLDYEGDLYGKDLIVEFVQWLRPEMRFADGAALVEQIRHDVLQARSALEGALPGS